MIRSRNREFRDRSRVYEGHKCQQFDGDPMRQQRTFRGMPVGMDERKHVIEQLKGELAGFGVSTPEAQHFQCVDTQGFDYRFLLFSLPRNFLMYAVTASGAKHRPTAFAVQAGDELVGPAIYAARPFIHGFLPSEVQLGLIPASGRSGERRVPCPGNGAADNTKTAVVPVS